MITLDIYGWNNFWFEGVSVAQMFVSADSCEAAHIQHSGFAFAITKDLWPIIC